MIYTIMVCPKCEKTTLPPGAFRWRCSECFCYFATTDERPGREDRERAPHWWERVRYRYAVQGKRIKVAQVSA